MSDLAIQLINEVREKRSTKLDLGKCNLKEIPKEVFDLHWLEDLNFGAHYWNRETNQFSRTTNNLQENTIATIPTAVRHLSSLKSFNLSNNTFRHLTFSGVEELSLLPNLVVLELSFGRISNVEWVKSLLNLQVLNLIANAIEDIHSLKSLRDLRHLFLEGNDINDISSLSEHHQLTQLILNQNKITDISPLKDLTSLEVLDLNSNRLERIDALKRLTSLRILDLHTNLLSDVNPLESLPNLVELSLRNNSLDDIRPLSSLTNLETLSIATNFIFDLSSLKPLEKLTKLYLDNNAITDLTPLRELSNLTDLYLDHNKIEDIQPLESLIKLKELSLVRNKISDVTPLTQMTNLGSLYLNSNSIVDIKPLAKLGNLTELNLSHNKISDVSPLLPLIQKDVAIKWKDDLQGGIIVEGNPLISPPIEIIVQGQTAVLNYFTELELQGTETVYEAKLLIIGEGGSGKTTLARKLQNDDARMPEERESTHGIEIHQLKLNSTLGYPMNVNIWDFGGQEIYHATHQFFLTKRSLYILVDDTRKDDRTVHDPSFSYWLQATNLFGGGSPLLIVQNEKSDRTKEIDLKGMMGRFDFIKDCLRVNLLTGERIGKVRDAVAYHLQHLPHVGTSIPKQWVAIRAHLEELSALNDYISLEEFLAICKLFHIEQEDKALLLSSYLHDIGAFLHFQDDPILENLFILDNQWVTHAVYKVLDNPKVKSQNGRFDKSDLAVIWSDLQYRRKHAELLALMIKFELCYELDSNKQNWLAPQLLPVQSPDNVWQRGDELILRFSYDFMPKGLLPRFIVRMHRYIKNSSLAWRSGVVLERLNSEALVSETDGREIAVRVKGPSSKELMTIISEEIEFMNSRYENLKVSKLIPCNCILCQSETTPHFYHYKNLIKRKENNVYTVQCENSYEDVEVQGLLDGVFSRSGKKQGPPFRVFISYSHSDEYYKDQLCNHLFPLESNNKITIWCDSKVKGGQEWNKHIMKQLDEADIILLLVSADFISSKYIWENEITRAIEKHQKQSATVIPIVIRSGDYTSLPFSTLQWLPKNAVPVDSFANKDDAFTDIAKGLRTVVEQLMNKNQ